MRHALSAIAALFLTAVAAAGVFEDANMAYTRADYQTAARLYEQMIEQGVAHASVFHNLGNAYYRMGRLGPAIANYERALLLDPRLEPARLNLEHALDSARRRLARPLAPDWQQVLLFWHGPVSPRAALAAALAFWFLFWTILVARLWHPIRVLRPAALLCALLAMLFMTSAWVKAHPPLLAVAAADLVPVRYGASENDTVRFELYEGDRVRVEDRYNDYVRVKTADGQQGWALESLFAFVGPPYLPPASLDRNREASETRP